MSLKNTGNQTKMLFLQRTFDAAVVILVSIFILIIYENYQLLVHSSKENMLAIIFDMYGIYYSLAVGLFMFVFPNVFEFINQRTFFRRFTSESQMPGKLVRILKIFILILIIILCSVIFADKNSRVEFYDTGVVIEYNKNNEIIKECNVGDIQAVELRTNHDFGRGISYWTEAVIYTEDSYYILSCGDYIIPDSYEINPDTEKSLYGLRKIKEIYSDKIRINTDNLDVLFEVEHYDYTQKQAKELCEIFEVDYDEMTLLLKEEWDIVFESDE